MLKHLYIKNFALIDELDIDFHAGFSVITGETGAGKSIILGAIGLLLGNRADTKAIKPGEQKCTVEAHFDLSKYGFESFFNANDIDFDPDDCIIRREVTSAGKSRAFINDTPVALQLMKQLGEQLVDIHSQHQNLLLQKEDFQLNVVDIIAHNQKEKAAYVQSYDAYKTAGDALTALQQQVERSRENEEFTRFQYNELHDAKLADGEQEELEQEQETLSHSEEIKTSLYEADNILSGDDNGIVGRLKSAAQALHSIEDVFPQVRETAERIDSAHIELQDIAADISNDTEKIDFDPARLDEISNRLDKIYSLEQKFHVETVRELLDIHDRFEKELADIDNGDEELQELQHKADAARQACEQQAAKLTAVRRKAAAEVEKQMQARLVPLGIPNVRFQVSITAKPLGRDGADKIEFLFSANKSTAMQPVAQVASGGEVARVMLSLKAMISGAVRLPTIIFDEIDTGVSGKIAQKMALIMQEMGDNGRQVISITHLPQIAALGSSHYKVYKEETDAGTNSHMVPLDNEGRIHEIAQMLSGDNVTDAALQNAKELLGL